MSPARARTSGVRARRAPAGARAHRAAGRSAGVAIITVSDTRRGAEDVSGARAAELVARSGHVVVARAWTRDEIVAIRSALRAALRDRRVDGVVLTGGTGVAARDRTPEAVAPLIDRWLPGFGERFRAASERQVGAAAWLSRAGAGIARGRLIVFLPGSTAAVDLALRRLVLPELGHVVALLDRPDRPPPRPAGAPRAKDR